jgi:hypothetical protein
MRLIYILRPEVRVILKVWIPKHRFFGARYLHRIQLFTVDGLERIKLFLKARLAGTHPLQRLLFNTTPRMVI